MYIDDMSRWASHFITEQKHWSIWCDKSPIRARYMSMKLEHKMLIYVKELDVCQCWHAATLQLCQTSVHWYRLEPYIEAGLHNKDASESFWWCIALLWLSQTSSNLVAKKKSPSIDKCLLFCLAFIVLKSRNIKTILTVVWCFWNRTWLFWYAHYMSFDMYTVAAI